MANFFIPVALFGTSCGLIYVFSSVMANGGTLTVTDDFLILVGELAIFIILALTGLAKAIAVIVKYWYEGRSGTNSHKRSKDVAETTNAK